MGFSVHTTASAPRIGLFRGSMAGLCAPLSTLRRNPRGQLRMTRRRCGSLLLHRKRLALSTPSRSPGASQIESATPQYPDLDEGLGVLPSVLCEQFPVKTRAVGVAFAFSMSVTIFGGFAPFVATWLVAQTGDPLSPSYYLLLSIIALMVIERRARLIP